MLNIPELVLKFHQKDEKTFVGRLNSNVEDENSQWIDLEVQVLDADFARDKLSLSLSQEAKLKAVMFANPIMFFQFLEEFLGSNLKALSDKIYETSSINSNYDVDKQDFKFDLVTAGLTLNFFLCLYGRSRLHVLIT